MADEISGWKPPIMYDVKIDEHRIVTQTDIELFLLMEQSYGRMRTLVSEIEREHQHLVAAIKETLKTGEKNG